VRRSCVSPPVLLPSCALTYSVDRIHKKRQLSSPPTIESSLSSALNSVLFTFHRNFEHPLFALSAVGVGFVHCKGGAKRKRGTDKQAAGGLSWILLRYTVSFTHHLPCGCVHFDLVLVTAKQSLPPSTKNSCATREIWAVWFPALSRCYHDPIKHNHHQSLHQLRSLINTTRPPFVPSRNLVPGQLKFKLAISV
jgi:hypothetical protein